MHISDLKHNFILGMQMSAIECRGVIEEEFEFDSEDKDVLEITEQYNKVKNQMIEEIASTKSADLFKNLPNNIQQFYTDIVGEYNDLPIFSKYDMDDLYNKLEVTSNYDLYNLVNMFTVRYKDKKELFKQDYKSLKKLCDIIRKNKHTKEKSIKLVLLDNIASVIEKIEQECD
jgi:hypothetical protein